MTSIILCPEGKVVTALFVFEKNSSCGFVQLGLRRTSLLISLGHERPHQFKSRNDIQQFQSMSSNSKKQL